MKNYKNMLHVMLTIVSIFGFIGGWATFAHSKKPAQLLSGENQTLDPLPPLDAFPNIQADRSNSNSFSVIAPSRPGRASRSFLSTGGS